MSTEQKNMELMQTLDDAWNSQDWDTFEKRHKPDTVVRWPAQPATHGVRPPGRVHPVVQDLPRQSPGQSTVSSLLRERRVDLLDRQIQGHNEGADGHG